MCRACIGSVTQLCQNYGGLKIKPREVDPKKDIPCLFWGHEVLRGRRRELVRVERLLPNAHDEPPPELVVAGKPVEFMKDGHNHSMRPIPNAANAVEDDIKVLLSSLKKLRESIGHTRRDDGVVLRPSNLTLVYPYDAAP